MAEHSLEEQLQFFFPKATRDDWEKIALQETGGKNPFETLSWRGKDDIKFLPYYDAQDTAGLYNVLPAEQARRTHQWLNLPAVKVLDAAHANKITREHLAYGANGVFLYPNQGTTFTMDVLTGEIDCSACNIFIRFNNDGHFDDIFGHAADSLLKLNGALFWESIPKTSKLTEHFRRCKHFCALGVWIPPSTPAQEVAQALLQGVQAYERFGETANAAEVFRSIAFSLATDVSFLESVAKIRALRSLWLQVARAYSHDDYSATDLHINARSLATPDAAYAPHENMLNATFASMAATAAGCDSLTIEGTVETPLFQRWSTNVSNILREESFFDRVANPLAGAYAVEVLSDAISQKAWEIFQQKVKAL